MTDQIWTGADILANQAQTMISERNEGYDRIRKLKETMTQRAIEKACLTASKGMGADLKKMSCFMEPGWDVVN